MHTMIDIASEMACEAHKGQRLKYTGKPHAEHLQRVATLVAAYPGSTLEMTAAAWLHDVRATVQIEQSCGIVVAKFVDELNPNLHKDLSCSDRKRVNLEHFAKVSREAKIIKMFDILDNLNSLNNAPRPVRALYALESDALVKVIGDADTDLRDKLIAIAYRYAFGAGPAPGAKR